MRWMVLMVLAVMVAGCENSDISSAKEAIRRSAKDPDSVNFRAVENCPGDPKSVTGEYNAKNGFGAYTGFNRFLYDKGRIVDSTELAGGLSGFRAALRNCYGKDATSWMDDPENAADDLEKKADQILNEIS